MMQFDILNPVKLTLSDIELSKTMSINCNGSVIQKRYQSFFPTMYTVSFESHKAKRAFVNIL